MSGTVKKAILTAAGLLCLASAAFAQGGEFGAYHPYSVFGVGDILQPGSAYNRTMGGVGIATRNVRYINQLNPAAVTARDSLSFMCDFSVYLDNRVFHEADRKSARNTMNINDLMMSFPIFKSSAMMMGIAPFSSTGYDFGYYEDDPRVISEVGNLYYSFYGQGSIYQGFIGAGVTFFDRISIGAQWTHYFGNVSKTRPVTAVSASALGFISGTTQEIFADGAKLGIQYEQLVGKKFKVCVGATYRTPAYFSGYVTNYMSSDGSAEGDYIQVQTDTLQNLPVRVGIAPEWGVGISVNYLNKFRAEVNYTRSDWSGMNLDKFEGFSCEGFSLGVSQAFRFGLEYTPNRNDVRYYFKRCAYRLGGYWQTGYYSYQGSRVVSRGITFGVTLPVFRWSNGITLGADIGKNGALDRSGIDETYFKFSLGLNLFDIWFQKPKYE